jgi:hypothetical protein
MFQIPWTITSKRVRSPASFDPRIESINLEAPGNPEAPSSEVGSLAGTERAGDGLNWDPPGNSVEREVWLQQYNKSVKADNAQTPCHLWDERVWSRAHSVAHRKVFMDRFNGCPLDSIRSFLLRRWVFNIRTGFMKYLRTKHGAGWPSTQRHQLSDLDRDIQAGAECIWRATEADWWEWKVGSRLLFWRHLHYSEHFV